MQAQTQPVQKAELTHRKIEGGGTSNIAEGLYRVSVMEHALLRTLRKQAFDMAGLTGAYNGTVEAYMSLSAEDKVKHDTVLAGLVQANQKELSEQAGMAEASSRPWAKNLILDQGLNNLCNGTTEYSGFSNYCAVGVGSTATYTDSGATTATSSGTTVTASGSFFTAGMVGQIIKFDTGEERYITAQSGTTCTINSSLTIASGTAFGIHAVNQTGLASESKRTNTYLTGSGNCGSSAVSNVVTYRRTYDFTTEIGNVNYSELGWSHSATVAANLNSRTLISGGSVSILTGQSLRVIYDLVVTFGPAVSTAGSFNITGWPVSPATNTNGSYILSFNVVAGAIPDISTSGNQGAGNFPFSTVNVSSFTLLSDNSTALTFGGSDNLGTNATANTNSFDSYTTGSFYRVHSATFNLTTGNATNWRKIYVGDSSGRFFAFVFDQAQTKANTHTLTVKVRATFGRTLTNS